MHGMQLSIKYDNSKHIKEEKVPSFRFYWKQEYIDEGYVTRSVYLVTILSTIGGLIVAHDHTSVKNETKHSPVIVFLSFVREDTQAKTINVHFIILHYLGKILKIRRIYHFISLFGV